MELMDFPTPRFPSNNLEESDIEFLYDMEKPGILLIPVLKTG